MGINQRISGSRKADSEYENTLIIINQPWVELPDNPFGQPKIKAKGGESIWLNSSLVFLFGNQKGSGTTKITATKDKRTVKFAIRTKVSVLKNHINGLGYEDGKIIVTPHGFLAGKEASEEKASKFVDYLNGAGIEFALMVGSHSNMEIDDLIYRARKKAAQRFGNAL